MLRRFFSESPYFFHKASWPLNGTHQLTGSPWNVECIFCTSCLMHLIDEFSERSLRHLTHRIQTCRIDDVIQTLYAWPQLCNDFMLGNNFSPLCVSAYSTVGGTVAKTSLVMIPLASRFFNSLTSILVLIPSTFLSISLKRSFPFDNMYMIGIAHFPPIMSSTSFMLQVFWETVVLFFAMICRFHSLLYFGVLLYICVTTYKCKVMGVSLCHNWK